MNVSKGPIHMRYLIDHRGARASCLGALLLSLNLIAACAQEQSASVPSGGGGSQSAGGSNGTGAPGGSTGTGVGTGLGGSTGGGASSGSAASSGSGATTGSGASTGLGTGTGATGGDGSDTSGAGASSPGGSGSGGAGPATGGSSQGGTSSDGGASSGTAGTSGASTGTGGRAQSSSDPTTFGLNGPSKCAAGNFAICEDFESTAVGAIPTGWTKEGTWATVVTAADKARGSHSLQISVGVDNNTRGFLNKTAAQLGPLASKHYGRIFYKLENPPTKFVHWDFFHGPGPYGAGNTNDVRWGFTGFPGPTTYLYNVQTSKGPEFGMNSKTAQLAVNQWTCVEWLIDSTVAGGGEARLWVNGTELTEMHRTGAQAQIPVFSQYGVGWELFNTTNTASTALIDEVVFDSQPIGCNN
jgi:hypothetical protein